MTNIELIAATFVTTLVSGVLVQWFALRARVQIERGQAFEATSRVHAEAIAEIRSTLDDVDKRVEVIQAEQVRQSGLLFELAQRGVQSAT